MGEKLSRREFVRDAAVAIAGAALSGSQLQLVRQAARSLKAQAAAAVDPDPAPARSQGEWAERIQELNELYLELSPEAQKMAFEAVHGLYIYCIQQGLWA